MNRGQNFSLIHLKTDLTRGFFFREKMSNNCKSPTFKSPHTEIPVPLIPPKLPPKNLQEPTSGILNKIKKYSYPPQNVKFISILNKGDYSSVGSGAFNFQEQKKMFAPPNWNSYFERSLNLDSGGSQQPLLQVVI